MNLVTLADSQTPIYINILLILGGLGALLIGMRLLQEATEKLATGGLQKMFKKTANSKLAGVGIGTLSTMIMQSSGATTIMVVGFVNAGVMSLSQATCYIMGANIGTTITAQLVALGGLSSSSIPLTQILISFSFIGVMLSMFTKKKFPKLAEGGNLIAGLGLLFLGLDVMTSNMKTIFLDENISKFLTEITNPFLLLSIGIILTVLAQSSSAVTSIFLATAIAGTVIGGSGNGILYVILGTNIGSCSTALLSAIGSSKNGKRTAIIHLLFNLLGSIIFLLILIFWKSFMDDTFAKLFPDSKAEQIAMFHTFFNVICTFIFLPFTKVFVFLANKIIPDRSVKTKLTKKLIQGESVTAEEEKGNFLDPRLLQTPEIALQQAVTFYHVIANKAMKDLNISLDGFIKKDLSYEKKVEDIEVEVLKNSKELTSFLVKISAAGVSKDSNKIISRMLLNISDIVRLTEIADNIIGYTKHEINDNLTFSDIVFTDLNEMRNLLNDQYKVCKEITSYPSSVLLEKSREIEDDIDKKRTHMVKGHLERMSKGVCSAINSNVFLNLVSNLERCGDHLHFIAERSCQKKIQEETDTVTLHP